MVPGTAQPKVSFQILDLRGVSGQQSCCMAEFISYNMDCDLKSLILSTRLKAFVRQVGIVAVQN